jgi:hypothetical protein
MTPAPSNSELANALEREARKIELDVVGRISITEHARTQSLRLAASRLREAEGAEAGELIGAQRTTRSAAVSIAETIWRKVPDDLAALFDLIEVALCNELDVHVAGGDQTVLIQARALGPLPVKAAGDK